MRLPGLLSRLAHGVSPSIPASSPYRAWPQLGQVRVDEVMRKFLGRLQQHWIQIALVLGVFVLLMANAGGVFQVFFSVGDSSLALPALVRTPEFILLVAIGVLLSTLLPVLSPIVASLVTFACMLPVFYLGFQVQPQRALIPMEYSLLTVLLLFVVNVLFSYFTETKKKQKLVDIFGQYIPPELVQEISRNPEGFGMTAEAREMSVMFCDVHNFTAMSERLEPPELAELLNTLLSPLTRILYRHHGVIDKYMGDGIMAFWGAPVADAHHAGNAVAAAFEIQEALQGLRRVFKARGWPEIHMGIGLNTGQMAVGNMGSEYRIAYTVIGDTVNLAARLQDLTRIYDAGIIVGETTRRAFPAATYRELGLVQVKGKNTLARIFEPCNPALDPESTLVANMHRHNEALRCYQGRKWDLAAELFTLLKGENPDDALYDYYLTKIKEFRVQSPPKGWKGEIRYSVK